MKIGEVEIKWLGHAGFLIKNSKVIYIDPYNVKEESPKADLILITHSHYDHCSVGDIKKIIKDGTKIIATADCQSKIIRFEVPIKIIEQGQELEFGDLKISALPAYNIDKHFHHKNEGWVGYLVKMNDVLIYYAGDTDFIPEMKNLTGYNQQNKKFIALLPIGGRFTMNVEEAVEAAKIIKPTLAIPSHFGSIIGSEEDAKEFVELCKEENINAEILGVD
ncbi:Zn-dependent hydrolase [Candidatus Pacearchaeota archaeon]|jgi:L-ascorbate metabolism protein UlaG (beta-lactamase superfamily)|nr:Zn-dependent hydrolase [Candidatus Pacearchaeota archaeon]|tara:strand:+ start:409 stop:1068 length:660 start_codon:yes stop_codon:yes gene_type:complete